MGHLYRHPVTGLHVAGIPFVTAIDRLVHTGAALDRLDARRFDARLDFLRGNTVTIESVDRIIAEQTTEHHARLAAGITAALDQLDGTPASAVALITGFSRAKLDHLGGVPER